MSGDLTVDLVDARRRAEPPGWAELVSRAAARTWAWPIVRATAEVYGGRHVVAVVRQDESVIGALSGVLHRPWGVWQVVAPGTTALPGIAVPSTFDSGGLRPDDPDQVAAVVTAAEQAIGRHYRTVRLVAYRQIFASLFPIVASGATAIYRGWPITWFDNEFADYDSYLASLSASRRGDQRRVVRRLDEDAAVRVEWARGEGSVDIERFRELVTVTKARNAGGFLERVTPRSMATVGPLAAGRDSVTVQYRRGGTLIGVSLSIDHPRHPVSSHWGALAPTDPLGRKGLWFDHQARVLRWVIESGKDGLIGGKGQNELKVTIGYREIPNWSLVRPLCR